MVLDHGPIDPRTLTSIFLQRLAKGSQRLFELRRPILALPEACERRAEIVLGRGPLQRRPLARSFFQRLSICCDRLLEFRGSTFTRSNDLERVGQTALGHGPFEWHAFADRLSKHLTMDGDGLFEPGSPALALAKRKQRYAQIVLDPGPFKRRPLGGDQFGQPSAPLDRREQSTIVAEFVSLLVESVCLVCEVAGPFIFVRAFRWKYRSRLGEVHSRFGIAQSGERNLTASG